MLVMGLATHHRTSLAAAETLAALEARDFRREVLASALALRGPQCEGLFALARRERDRCFPQRNVEVRSVIEISNICRQGCRYCNMGKGRKREPYTIDVPLFLNLVTHLYGQGRRVLLLQSGENPVPSFIDLVCECIAASKKRFPHLTLILCLGNLQPEQYQRLRAAGADRYVLKFETSNPVLYSRIKPLDTLETRLHCLEQLIALGYGVGSGNIVGLPDQTLEDIVNDLYLVNRYALTMSSCTAFIPAEDSELRDHPIGDLDLTLNVLALMRIMNPDRLIPTTSALEKVRAGGQLMGLMAGANTVTIHDGTPAPLKALFPIYSVHRFVPNTDYMKNLVEQAGMMMECGGNGR
jgi:biotin synthase